MLEGDKLKLTCQANNATSQIQWKKDNVSVSQRANITQTDYTSILVIEKAESSDSGEYTCEVVNPAGRASAVVRVKIRGNIKLYPYSLS